MEKLINNGFGSRIRVEKREKRIENILFIILCILLFSFVFYSLSKLSIRYIDLIK